MSELDRDRDLDAAERVLGTLPEGGRARDRDVAAWTRRLAPFDAVTPTVPPPPRALAMAFAEIDAEDAERRAERLERARAWWRRATLAFGTVAAAAVALLVLALGREPDAPVTVADTAPVVGPEAEAPVYVAVVTDGQTGTPGLIVQFDTGSGLATIVPAAGAPPPDHAWEIWHHPEGDAAPRSLGLLPAGPVVRASLAAQPGDLLSLSLEPLGGSPSGSPTELIFQGRIERIR